MKHKSKMLALEIENARSEFLRRAQKAQRDLIEANTVCGLLDTLLNNTDGYLGGQVPSMPTGISDATHAELTHIYVFAGIGRD